MSEALRRRGLAGFVDLVPWADPYIASLVNKVERESARAISALRGKPARAECPPPSLGEFSHPSRDFDWGRRDGWKDAT